MRRSTRVLARLLVPVTAVAALPGAGLFATATAAFANVRSCNSSTVNWAAIYPDYQDWLVGTGVESCIGDKGTWTITKADQLEGAGVFCAGNNYGSVTWKVWTGVTRTTSFTDDRSYSVVFNTAGVPVWNGANPAYAPFTVLSVTINGWRGSAGC